MSYLDVPRIHFGGKFQASPSTFNNTPNNYEPRRWHHGADRDDPTGEIELYWSPLGNGVFDLVECAVTAVVPAGGYEGHEPLEGQPVGAVHNPVPPKLVDLDPMQQNVSEVWGLEVQIGDVSGAWVRGSYVAGPFSSIWQNSQGQNTPRNSQSGGAVYQSSLVNLMWNNPEGAGHSPVLAALRRAAEDGVSSAVPEPRLSIRMVVNTHNNKPHTFLFSEKAESNTFAVMKARGVPSGLVDKLKELEDWVMTLPTPPSHGSQGSPGSPPGLIPTEAYVNLLLNQKLGEQDASRWGQTILDATRQPYVTEDYMTFKPPQAYDTVIPTPFNYGLITGTVGAVDKPTAGEPPEPVYAVPARVLAPPKAQLSPPDMPTCFFMPAKLRDDALTIDLGNSLPVELPGRPPWKEKLGTLTLKCGSSFSHTIDYDGDLLTRYSGILDIPLAPGDHDTIADSPLTLVGTPGGTETTLLAENSEGLSVRADQFVFRMNPAREASEDGYIVRGDGSPEAGQPLPIEYPRGKTATVRVYARKFGRVAGTEDLEIGVRLLTPPEANKYTGGTPGTSGTKGVADYNISVPQDAVDFPATARVDADGVAKFTITVTDPGNPRHHVDGQVYFLDYVPQGVADYVGDPNDKVSLHVFQHSTRQDEYGQIRNTTWQNGIGRILKQYGRLYPVMSVFGLSSYRLVVKNHAQIRRVLEVDFEQALHMPVTRDLSASRRQLILDWMDNGMPES